MSGAAAGSILIGLEGTTLAPAEGDWLCHPATGGVVLFARNFESREQVSELTAAIRRSAGRDLLIAVDQEGGRVQRFLDGFTRLPALAVLGRMFEDDPDKACDMAYRHGRVMATEILLCGVDMSFAPVLDLDRESCVIGDRSFSPDPDAVIRLGGHYLAGMHDAGMKTCGKHFPGHGSVKADSHVDDVCDDRPLRDIEAKDLRPFRALAARLDSVMMAHVVYPSVDDRPAGYSAAWIGDWLRGSMGFEGVVFSDDLGMHAAGFAGKLPDRMRISLEAGCDAVLVCHPDEVRELYRGLEEPVVGSPPAVCRLLGRSMHSASELETVGEWRHWRESLERLENSKWA
jgi:beta-N-acetylhexosaminidase